MSPISGLTFGKSGFVCLGNIRKGEKDEKGRPRDLDHFRVTFKNHPLRDKIESAFRAVYGDRPTSLNVRFAFPDVDSVWDANYECYKKGGLYAKVGSTRERGPYWIFYRDPANAEVLVRDGMAVNDDGAAVLSKPPDLSKPIYVSEKGVATFLSPVGRLEVVIPEVAPLAVGYFEFRPVSPRDIRNVSAELTTYALMASQYGKSLLGIPFRLFRREEQISKRIDGNLTMGPSWVVHLDVTEEWGPKALAMLDQLALPEIIEGDVDEAPVAPELLDVGPLLEEQESAEAPAVPVRIDDEMIDPHTKRWVEYAAKQWNKSPEEAAGDLWRKYPKGTGRVSKSAFLQTVG